MSVLIRGMDMPNSCVECALFNIIIHPEKNYCGALYDFLDDSTCSVRSARCPIVEVPTPHGALIDINTLQRLIVRYDLNSGEPINIDIGDAEIVIPEEEGCRE